MAIFLHAKIVQHIIPKAGQIVPTDNYWSSQALMDCLMPEHHMFSWMIAVVWAWSEWCELFCKVPLFSQTHNLSQWYDITKLRPPILPEMRYCESIWICLAIVQNIFFFLELCIVSCLHCYAWCSVGPLLMLQYETADQWSVIYIFIDCPITIFLIQHSSCTLHWIDINFTFE